jgi:hypothetical protein
MFRWYWKIRYFNGGIGVSSFIGKIGTDACKNLEKKDNKI